MLAKAPPARWLEWRARRYGDPLRRLRYLRASTGQLRRKSTPRYHPCFAVAVLLLTPVLLSPSGITRGGVTPSAPPLPPPNPGSAPAAVWLVEAGRGYEVFSNGLRIEISSPVFNGTRTYPAIAVHDANLVESRSTPAGIVYHTTESHMAPFDPHHNARLRRVGKWLLDYVRENRCYHYLIDRFGRVHRIVVEDSPANHAGSSLWADREWVYTNLNQAFLGVSFELETAPGDAPPDILNPAQIRAARELTEMLRSRYSIPAANCVTHAQVSVNPRLRRIGLHTDWAANFPFESVGLPDNYALPTPSVVLAGFGWDNTFVSATGPRLWRSLALSEELLRQQAVEHGLPLNQYRAALQKRWAALFPARQAGN
jgi:hypothetical protein